MCHSAFAQSVTAPSDKERQKTRRATVASSKPYDARTTKSALSSNDVESSEAETDAKVGQKTGGRHGNRTAAAVSTASSTVSIEPSIDFI